MDRTITLVGPDGDAVCDACVVADSYFRRLVGLLGRSELPSGGGLLLRRTSSIHTHFMRFPIDVVFLDGDNRVLKIVPRLRPWRAAAARGAASVLELPAGECERRGLCVGAVLAWGIVARAAA